MSNPRAATSEATSTLSSPRRNASSVRVRWLCSRSPWIGDASKPCFFNDLATTSTSDLRLQNTIPFFTSSLATSVRNARRLTAGSTLGTRTMCWAIPSAGFAWRGGSLRPGTPKKFFGVPGVSRRQGRRGASGDKVVDHRQGEGRCRARAGLGDAQNIPAGGGDRYGFGLNGGGDGVPRSGHRL